MSIEIDSGHFFIHNASAIAKLCQPLNKLGITMFTYMHKFADRSTIYFSNSGNWVEDYYNQGLYSSSMFEGHYNQYISSSVVWPVSSNLRVFEHGVKKYNSDHGLTLIQRHQDSCEFFFFSTSKDNVWAANIYLNELDLFNRFAVYFKTAARKLLNQAHRHRIYYPDKLKLLQADNHDCLSLLDQQQRREFLHSTQIKHYTLEQNGFKHIDISGRELACAVLLMRCPNAKKIAENLGISPRTVEIHLANLKDKLGCTNKQELIYHLKNCHLPKACLGMAV